ncbi:MAG: hypothetical protein RBT78_03270 [Kiritimatiellia bacterium]|jgi:hypothetical protein|nr:hypothetical protein [Kiritimatiellia bacterium]
MSPVTVRRVLKQGPNSVFVGAGPRRTPASWRLDVREDAAGNSLFFGKRRRPALGGRSRNRLFHYIAAGGLRQLRRTSADDDREARSRAFLVFLALLSAVWLLFYFLPCL